MTNQKTNEAGQWTLQDLKNIIADPHSEAKIAEFKKISQLGYMKNGPRSQLIALFFETLYQPFLHDQGTDLYLEFDFKDVDGNFQTSYYALNDTNLLRAADMGLNKNNMSDCAYFGVNPRLYPRKHDELGYEMRATNSCIAHSAVLWIDIDAKSVDAPEGVDPKQHILNKIDELPVQPSIVVDSGNGFHLYFLLDTCHPVNVVSDLCARMEQYIGYADHCHDASRILRLPGSKNYKDRKNIKLSRFIRFDSIRYSIDKFDFLPSLANGGSSVEKHMERVELPDLSGLPQLSQDEISQKITRDKKLMDKLMVSNFDDYQAKFMSSKAKDRSRSGRDFHCICQLIKEGFIVDEITSVFYTLPVGEKFRERMQKDGKNAAMGYLAATIENSLAAVAKEQAKPAFRVSIISKPRY